MTDQPKPITREEIDDQLNELLDVMQQAGRDANRVAKEEGIEGARIPSRVNVGDESFRALRELIEDSVPVTSPVGDKHEIDPWEEHREIAKRALARLKLLQLRTIAESIGVPKSGRRDALLDRIVRRLQANKAEIARLVVMYAEDLPSELRHTTRLYPLEHRVPSAGVFERLSGYARRYIKVGIAQWFRVRRIEQISGGIFVEGTYRSYRVGATAVSDDETTYELESVRRDLSASALIRPGTSFLEMRAGGAGGSRRACASRRAGRRTAAKRDAAERFEPTVGRPSVGRRNSPAARPAQLQPSLRDGSRRQSRRWPALRPAGRRSHRTRRAATGRKCARFGSTASTSSTRVRRASSSWSMSVSHTSRSRFGSGPMAGRGFSCRCVLTWSPITPPLSRASG